MIQTVLLLLALSGTAGHAIQPVRAPVDCVTPTDAWLDEGAGTIERHARKLEEQHKHCEPRGRNRLVEVAVRREQLRTLFGRELFLLQRLPAGTERFRNGLEAMRTRWVSFLRADPELMKYDQSFPDGGEHCWLLSRIMPEACPSLAALGAKSQFDMLERITGSAGIVQTSETGTASSDALDLLKSGLVLELLRPASYGKESIEFVLTNIHRVPPTAVDKGRFRETVYHYFPELLLDRSFARTLRSLLGRFTDLHRLRLQFDVLNQADHPPDEYREVVIQYVRYRKTEDKTDLEPLRGAELTRTIRQDWFQYRRHFLELQRSIASCKPEQEDCLRARKAEQFVIMTFLFWSAVKSNPPRAEVLAETEAAFDRARADGLRENRKLVERAKRDPDSLRLKGELVALALQSARSLGNEALKTSLIRRLGADTEEGRRRGISRARLQVWGALAVGLVIAGSLALTIPSGGSSLVFLGVTASTWGFGAAGVGGTGLALKEISESNKDLENAKSSFRYVFNRADAVRSAEERLSEAHWEFYKSIPSLVLLPAISFIHSADELARFLAIARVKVSPQELAELQRALTIGVKGYHYGKAGYAAAQGHYGEAAFDVVFGRIVAPKLGPRSLFDHFMEWYLARKPAL